MYPLRTAIVFATLQIISLCDAKPSGELETMPDDCRGKNYCLTKHKDYPEEAIQNLLKDIDQYFVESDNTLLSSNNAPEPYSPCDCDTATFISPIYEIIDEAGNLRFVAQSEKKFRQIIRIEECLKPGRILENTYNFPDVVLQFVNLSCVQTFIPYKFIVLSLDGKSLEEAWVKGGVSVSCSTQLEG